MFVNYWLGNTLATERDRFSAAEIEKLQDPLT